MSELCERALRLKEVGAGMMLWPNATRILKNLGQLDDIIARTRIAQLLPDAAR